MPQVIGLDVGARAVKAALFERVFRGLELLSFHKVPVDPADPESGARALREISAQLLPGHATVVARIPGDRVMLRFLELPIGDARKLEPVIPFEIEQVIPAELDQVVLDFTVLDRTSTGGSRLVAAAVPKAEVAGAIERLTAAGLDPRFLGAGPATLAPLTLANPALARGTVAIVDAGFVRTDLCILAEGRLLYARTLSVGGADLGEMSGTDVSRRGGPDDAVAQAGVDHLTREVRRTLLSAESEGKGPVDRIVLVGGLAHLQGFPALLERAAGVPVEPVGLAAQEWAKGKLSAEEESDAAGAVAAAFRAVADPAQAGPSFRKGEYAFKRDSREMSGLFTRLGAMAAGLLFLAVVNYGVRERLLAHQRSVLDRQIAEAVNGAFPEVPKARLTDPDTALSIMRGSVNDARSRLEQLGSGGISALEVLTQISSAVPAGMYLDVKRFELTDDGKAVLQCDVDTFEATEKLTAALKAVSIFKNVESTDQGQDVNGKKKMSVKLDVVPAEGQG